MGLEVLGCFLLLAFQAVGGVLPFHFLRYSLQFDWYWYCLLLLGVGFHVLSRGILMGFPVYLLLGLWL